MLKSPHNICLFLGCCCLLSPMCVFSVSVEENQSTREQTMPSRKTSALNSNNKFSKTHKYFIKQIFDKYGHDGFITFEGFEHLLVSLGINLSAHRKNESTSRIFVNLPATNYNYPGAEDNPTANQENRTIAVHDSSKNTRLHNHHHHHHEHSSSENDNAKDQNAHPGSSKLTAEESALLDRTKNQNGILFNISHKNCISCAFTLPHVN